MLYGYKIGASGWARCVWMGTVCLGGHGVWDCLCCISQYRVETLCSMYLLNVKRDRRPQGTSFLFPDKTVT